jgi:hypothetical protein
MPISFPTLANIEGFGILTTYHLLFMPSYDSLKCSMGTSPYMSPDGLYRLGQSPRLNLTNP